MNEVRVAAPGAGVRRTLVEAKRVNGGETDFFHGALTVGRACHSGIDTWGSFRLSRKTYLALAIRADTRQVGRIGCRV